MELVLGCLASFLIGGAVSYLIIKGHYVSRKDFNALLSSKHQLEKDSEVTEERLKTQTDYVEVLKEQMKLQFENLAHKIFQENSTKFNQESQKSLAEIINPLRERFQEFQKKVDESFGTQAKEQFALKKEIANIIEANKEITLQAQSLTKALKGDNKMQGNWGEMLLEKILEESGLRKNIDYIPQGADLGMQHPETGGRLKPDIIVKLPDDRHIIIDSKVSLTHYERWIASEEEPERLVLVKEFTKSLRAHVNGLEGKRYQDTSQIEGTLDFVLMFVPIEGAYALAMQQDPEMLSYAWDKRIVLVCPSTLFASLRTVASLWQMERINKNAQEIASRGGVLYDKFCGFIDDMDKIGDRIGQLRDSYDGAINKLSTGRGNLISNAQKLIDLGATASKKLPAKHTAEITEKEEEHS